MLVISIVTDGSNWQNLFYSYLDLNLIGIGIF